MTRLEMLVCEPSPLAVSLYLETQRDQGAMGI